MHREICERRVLDSKEQASGSSRSYCPSAATPLDGSRRRKDRVQISLNCSAAFTLIELVLVMALLATVMAISAPSLARSFHGRNLDSQAAQLLAATEYARAEAISQGIPMNVWIDDASSTFGVQAKAGYEGVASRAKMWTLHPDVHFDTAPTRDDQAGHTLAATFQPEGSLDLESVNEIRLVHRSGEAIALSQTDDGYEIVK